MLRSIALTVIIFLLAGIQCGCGASGIEPIPQSSPEAPLESQSQKMNDKALPETGSSEVTEMDKQLTLAINGEELSVTWENNASVEALREAVSSESITVQMSKYGGFEQVGALGTSLPRDDVQTTTEPGDIVLYSGNQIVVFYGSNSWAYTKLGRIQEKSTEELAEMLGRENVTLTISIGSLSSK